MRYPLSVRFFVLLGPLAFLAGLAACGTAPMSPLPPEAGKAFHLGLGHADLNRWEQAQQHFAQAQKLQPTFPPILFNLGVAESKLGRELSAIAWLEAYLVTAENIPEATLIRGDIHKLQVKAQARLKDACARASGALKNIADEGAKESALHGVCKLQAHIGDMDGALRVLGSHACPGLPRSKLWSLYGASLARAGSLSEAATAANHTDLAEDSDAIWMNICEFHISTRSFQAAREAAYRLQKPNVVLTLLTSIQHKEDADKSVQPALTKAQTLTFTLTEWVKTAQHLSSLDVVKAFDGELKKAASNVKVEDQPRQLMTVVAQLGTLLSDVQGLQEKHSRLLKQTRE